MSTSKALDIQAMPFFARFLAEQEPPQTPQTPQVPTPPPIWTFKYPSDWEDGY
ncbi:microviridin/marinostatin family tricyclic proteinase inhibitor [Nostoc sp. UHCC 0702]|nr:microviridin/marinostatin family tricyclic proteinase inhibitor [Nostoc sp. UHCC 0702]